MKRPWKTSLFVLIAATLMAGLTLLYVPKEATAANPTTISFQGKVVNANGTNVADGTYSFLFKLYTVSSGGSAIWTETQGSTTVTAGVFQVNLGSSCPFFTANACNNATPIDFNANPNLYLGITFNSDPAGEMDPRVQLQSVPFAFNSDRVGGLTASQLVQLSPSSQQTGFINVSGNSTIGGTLAVGSTINGATISGGTLSGSTLSGTGLTFSAASTAIIQPAASQALTITGHAASTFGTDSGTLTLQGGSGTVSLGTSTNFTNTTGGLNIAAGGTTQPIKLDGATTGKVQIGSISSGDVEIAGQGTGNILFGGGGGAGGNGCSITNSNGNLTCDGAINSVTGINTGASGGTQRIDGSGNLVAIGNITTTAGTTIANAGAGNDITVTSQDQITFNTGTSGLAVVAVGTTTAVSVTDGTNTLARIGDAGTYGTLQLGAKSTTGNDGAQCGATDIGKIYVNSTDKAVFACTASGIWEQLDNGRSNVTDATGTFSITTTDTIVDQVTITPSTANSDVQITYDGVLLLNSTGIGNAPVNAAFRIVRGSTCAGGTLIKAASQTGHTVTAFSISFGAIDTGPTSGSSNTYLVCVQRSGGGGTTTSTIKQRTLIVREVDISGADYAEVYYSANGDIEPGTIITNDTSIKAGVKSSTSSYQKGLLGVVSTRPGQIVGDDTDSGTPVIVALAGRVPVKVSSENGSIDAGDSLTASSIPGVAMKATKAGTIIGTAMTDYAGQGIGEVMLFVSTGQSAGTLPLTLDNNQFGGKQLLTDLIAGRAELADHVDLSSIFTDRLAAGLEIITPKLISDEVKTNNIVIGESGIKFTNDKGETVATIDSAGVYRTITLSDTDETDSALITTNNSPDNSANTDVTTSGSFISKNGSFQLVDASSNQVFNIDNGGNANFSGNLNLASASVSGGLSVGGDANFAGLSTFQKLATFLGKTIFRQDVEFEGRITVASNTAGYASLRAGESKVHVGFSVAYTTPPVVSANIVNGQFGLSSVSNVTESGFDIELQDPAAAETTFGWTAFAVNNPQTASNPLPAAP